jgi:hypothetical protein
MIDWTWTRTTVDPGGILDAMDTIKCGPIHYARLTSKWLLSNIYLSWAQQALAKADEFGFDAAVCYAKRAVCRQVDAFMVNNHLRRFLHSAGYPQKVEALAKVGLHSPTIIHDIIIDPRNDIEHEYQAATEPLARKAVELARLFLDATIEEAGRDTVIGFGWMIGRSYNAMDTPTEKWERVEYSISKAHSPMLFIDVTNPSNHQAIVLRPKAQELLICPMQQFSLNQAIELARRLRTQFEAAGQNWTRHEGHWLVKLRQDLDL